MNDELNTAADLTYREAGSPDAPAVVCLHGWPQSSWMWRGSVAALARAGLRGIAPDLPGYGGSPLRRPATWEMHRVAFGQFVDALGLQNFGLAVHDWGGLIGLRWACDNPGRVNALCISDTGFFADGKWHDLARSMRTSGEGEALIEALDRSLFGASLSANSPGMCEEDIDEYFRPFATPEGRLAQLDLYRSGEFSELETYDGAIAGLGVPVHLLWGADDPFAPVAGARRFLEEIPGAELELVAGAGHFVADDAPEVFAERLTAFFARVLLA